jgi:multiple sugar transport system substrate-binding protein
MYGNPHARSPRLRASVLGGASALVFAFALTGCSDSDSTATDSASAAPALTADTGEPITVWVDADRVAAADAYKAAYPDDPITVETYDGGANGSGTFRTKVQLFDTAGSGWPDVVFSTQNNDAAWASQLSNGKDAYAAVLNEGLIADDVIAGFATGALDPCTLDGKVYCLRNDLSQTALWYNKTLLDEFGYELPTTWEEYTELGVKVAAEHPGYIIGTQGDPWTPEIYFWAGKCEANNITGATSVTVNTESTECTRVAEMLDTLRANGTNPNISVFTPEFLESYAGKVLMIPGPAWYGGALFQNPDNLNVPAGNMAVAAPLPWEGEEAVAGNVGGATWFVSSHSANPGLAAKFVTFVTTADAYQVDLAPGFPAFAAAEQKWLEKQDASGYYAESVAPLVEAGGMIWSGWGAGIFSQEAIWAKTMTPGITEGKDLVDLLPEWQTAISNQAEVDGYTVN